MLVALEMEIVHPNLTDRKIKLDSVDFLDLERLFRMQEWSV